MSTRILFIGQTGVLGGAELVLLDVARHYRDRCHVVLLSDGPLRHRLDAVGVSCSVLRGGQAMLAVSRHGGRMQSVASAPAVAVVVAKLVSIARQYDVIYPNSQKAAIAALVAGLIVRRPVLWHLHDILSPEHFGGLQRRAVVGLANRGARRVIANSGAARDAFVAAGGRDDLVGVVPNGIDHRPFDAVDAAQIDAMRVDLGLTGLPLVGLFGRLSPWKGQHVLLDALPRLPGVHAVMVGDAMFGETDYKATLLRQADALDVAGRVHWLGFRDDVPALMRMVDIVLHSSTSPEPFGRVIVEGMLARRPVLATRGGGATEILGQDSDALLPPGDAGAVAAAVATEIARPESHRVRRVADAHDRAMTRFSLDGMLAGIDLELAKTCREDAAISLLQEA